MAPKLIILLYVYSKKPHYNTVSLITLSVSINLKYSITVSSEIFARTLFSQIFANLLPPKFKVLANKESL